MKISVISPSYNQVKYIEKTLLSVASQEYVEKEHIVVDGGSDDGCADVIKRFETGHPYLRSIIEPDRGQADAINKGFRAATGDILAWINTDDAYLHPEVFSEVAKEFQSHPEADVIYGRGVRLDADGKPIKEAYINRSISGPESLRTSLGIFQPSVFFRRKVFEAVGGLSEEYHLQLDYEYWIRMLKAGFRFHFLDKKLAVATVHQDAKSTRDRLRQLSECISMIGQHYRDVPEEWVSRFANFYATKRDEKVEAVRLSENEARTRDVIAGAERAALQGQGLWHPAEERLAPAKRIIITSFDQKYFSQGINLIASLHRTSFFSFDEIHVYPLGLSDKQLHVLGMLEKLRIVSYPKETPPDFPDFYEPAHRAYKVAAIASKGAPLEPGTLVLWMDAGMACCSDVDEIFRHIENDGFFITDHDDSAAWPFYNVSFLHRRAAEVIQPSVGELLAPHLCSCIVGYETGGSFQRLVDDAYQMGIKREAVVWPKVASSKEKAKLNAGKGTHFEAMAKFGLDRQSTATSDELYATFPYYGHRTQSIYSILSARYGAPVHSAKLYHKANESSQKAAHTNWLRGADETEQGASRTALEGVEPETRVYQHRGVFNDQSGLIFRHTFEPVVILGNGPSLRGLNFQLLKGRRWLGMNAAYRYWDEIGIYPYIYVCLDEVVLKSHQDAIKRLIERREEYGIQWFFLRRSFLEFWPEAETIGSVFLLEDLQKSVDWFDRGKITTGSFSLYFCCFLGFAEIYIAGVDLDYVEKIPEADAEGRELVIRNEVASNPNYFFDGYQKPGDRYNPPNRHPDMHLRSWTEAAEVLGDFPVSIFNCNSKSAVRNFSFVNRDTAIAGMGSSQLQSLRIADRTAAFRARQCYWRKTLLTRIGVSRSIEFLPDAQQVERFGRWLAQAMTNGAASCRRIEGPRTSSVIAGGLSSSAPAIFEPDGGKGDMGGASRDEKLRVDETQVVSALSAHKMGTRHVMLDVGAHHGSSAAYFDKLGWTIHCFEPDPKNREKLVARFGKSANVRIDTRAVSDKPAKGVAFFQSEESTGISGLHAFRDTHRESGRVDVTTVAEIVRERGIDHVDFLKIDVEGFDFNVIKGVPWDRIKPDVIECEYEDAKTLPMGHRWQDVADYLRERGYAVYVSEWHPIIRYGIAHDWRRVVPYPGPDVPSDSWGNLLAFREDPGYAAVQAAFEKLLKKRPGAAPQIKPATASVPHTAAPVKKPESASMAMAAAQPPRRAARPPSPPITRPYVEMPPLEPVPAPHRPFYADFGEWLMWRSPRLFRVLQRGRRAAARSSDGMKAKAPPLFRLGQLVGWLFAAAWRHKLATLLLVLVCAVLIGSPFYDARAWPWRFGLWAAAAVLLAAAAAGVVLRQAVRRVAIANEAAVAKAVREVRQSSERRSGELERRLGARAAEAEKLARAAESESRNAAETARSEIARLAAGLESSGDAADAREEALRADLKALRQGIDQRLRAEVEDYVGRYTADAQRDLAGLRAELARLSADMSLAAVKTASREGETSAELRRLADAANAKEEALRADLRALRQGIDQRLHAEVEERVVKFGATVGDELAEVRKGAEAQGKRLAGFETALDAAQARAVSLDVVSALRAMRPFWLGGSAVEHLKSQPEVEHGHALLMAVLADEAAGRPDWLAGKTIIEVGSTRERDAAQGSTEKLAIFTTMTGMRFVTVDMDPLNTKHAERVLRYLNPAAQAVTAKGEDYLAIHAGPLDIVYLDAFDFYHDKHSKERQERYDTILHTDINDEECWRMHLSCAETIVARMPQGGIVALDDTWTDSNGNYAGKGKLAMPFLLDHGFEIIARTRRTIALRRTAKGGVGKKAKAATGSKRSAARKSA